MTDYDDVRYPCHAYEYTHPEHLYVMGLATDYCVRASALGAMEHGFRVTVVPDGMRAVNLQPRDGQEALAAMLAAGAGTA